MFSLIWLCVMLHGIPEKGNHVPDFSQSAETVDAYDFIEVTIRIQEPDVTNPFTDVAITGTLQREGGVPVAVDGFCDSMDGSLFRVRFMPTETGRYEYTIRYVQGPSETLHQGSFKVVESTRRGPLRVDESGNHFVWEGTGEHYFWNGTTTYYLMGWQDDAEIYRMIDRLHAHKVNRLRVLVYGRNQDRPWRQPVQSIQDFRLYLNPWIAERPDDVADPGFDLTRFNVPYWQKYERMLRYARERDVIISVISFIGGQVLPTPFAEGSEDERRYYRYTIARLAAFANVTWDLGNEHDFHRKYPEWADVLGPLVKQWDPYDHLTAAHNKIYRTPGASWNDLQLIQRWDAGQNSFMLAERDKQAETNRIIPQINEEYGYEDLWEKLPGQRAAETRRRLAWEIAMVGCYQTTGETAERGTGFPPNTGGGWVNGRGDSTMVMLHGYAHMVDFFTSFAWWKAEPRNERVDDTAYCLAESGTTYVLYLPEPVHSTIQLEQAQYQARWFNPRTGNWGMPFQANGPVWTSPMPPDDGDWALLLQADAEAQDTAPPAVRSITASGDGSKLSVQFSELVDNQSATSIANYAIAPSVCVEAAELGGEDGQTAILSVSGLMDGNTYQLTVSGVKDSASPPNVINSGTSLSFEFTSVFHPLVSLHFDEKQGITASSGTSVATLTLQRPVWTTNVPPSGGTSALDFGVEPGNYAVDMTEVSSLKRLKSFTITGWVNCRDNTVGSGGNRVVSWINHGGDGVDLVFLENGSMQVGINAWPDGSPASSSAGQIPVDAEAKSSNWRFFAVTYDATLSVNHVRFYFGSPTDQAQLDRAVNYSQGTVGAHIGPALSIGHFNPATRPNAQDRMFRGIIDEIRVYGSMTDSLGALSLERICIIQAGK